MTNIHQGSKKNSHDSLVEFHLEEISRKELFHVESHVPFYPIGFKILDGFRGAEGGMRGKG